MEQKNEKICRCGRIIIDPKNITGLCPRCQKTFLEWAGPAAAAGVGYVATKYGKPIVNSIKDSFKNIKK